MTLSALSLSASSFAVVVVVSPSSILSTSRCRTLLSIRERAVDPFSKAAPAVAPVMLAMRVDELKLAARDLISEYILSDFAWEVEYCVAYVGGFKSIVGFEGGIVVNDVKDSVIYKLKLVSYN